MAIFRWATENTYLQVYYSDCYEILHAEVRLGVVGRHAMVVKDFDQVGHDIKSCSRHSSNTTKRNFAKILRNKKVMGFLVMPFGCFLINLQYIARGSGFHT